MTMYRIRIRERKAPHTWLKIISSDGRPLLQTGTPRDSVALDKSAAQLVAAQWAHWLNSNGFPGPARCVEIVPATGGTASLWKPLCPVCGAPVKITGETTDGRIIGSCNDAFTRSQWTCN